jgi:2-oxoglutarate dehydrogenase E1 component
MDIYREFPGPNAGYVVELYERYLQDPDSVDLETRAFFERQAPTGEVKLPSAAPVTAPGLSPEKIAAAINLALAIRSYGHLAAALDPLGSAPPGDPALDLATHGLTEGDLRALPAAIVGGPLAQQAANALEAIQALRSVYSSHIGYDWAHIRLHEEREWLLEAAESGWFRPPECPIDPVALLERLSQVEAFEQFLNRAFPGRTRFSVEGLDMMVPMLDDIIGESADAGICTIFIGMAHRGRLNVLAHILNKPYAEILAEFRDTVGGYNLAVRDDLGWTGDVKYHRGARRAIQGGEPVSLTVIMPPNPSHVEQVNPIVEGMARAVATAADQPGAPQIAECASMPILVHGDASFSGQGIVSETLNLSHLERYSVSGTIHLIANNQLGFTTPPSQQRSTFYASDLAKGFEVPVVHVNADDPEACIEATRLAFAYRQQFHKDFLIDLIGYRRHGHNEGDEPGFTQPVMYETIDSQPSVRALWAQTLVDKGLAPSSLPEELVRRYTDELQQVLETLVPAEVLTEPQLQPPPRGAAGRVHTAVPADQLRAINASLERLPEGFRVFRRLERILQRRRRSLDDDGERAIDWGTAEELAFASILADGIPIRLAGQDVERGTFSQRLAVLHDAEQDIEYIPLQALPQARAAFEIANSPLSEAAALGFEYGYNIAVPHRLAIWEAQYGDFANGAQVVVDEFIVSGRAKWEQTPSLVVLLPHANEGQGPDHSSGRLERYLSLTGEINLRIAFPTTAAQYFHLLRRQAALLEVDPLPLIVMTPKSLLRHPAAASSLRDLAEGHWQPVLVEDPVRFGVEDPVRFGNKEAGSSKSRARRGRRGDSVRRLILCTGKVYVDLIGRKREGDGAEADLAAPPAVAMARIEQLYPFPEEAVGAVVERYPALEQVVWVQEEPENMGAWQYVRPYLQELIAGRWPLHYLGRPPSSSPAEGSSALYAVNQAALVEQAYNLDSDMVKQDSAWLKSS